MIVQLLYIPGSSSRSLTPTHSQVGIVLCAAVVTFDLFGGWDLLISGRNGLVGSGCTLTLVSKGDISRNSSAYVWREQCIYNSQLSVCLISSCELVYVH